MDSTKKGSDPPEQENSPRAGSSEPATPARSGGVSTVEGAQSPADSAERGSGEPLQAEEDSDLDLGTRKRGIETMFRSLYRVHMDLSSLADTKANIMISINGIIISIIVAAISPKMDTNPWLLIPTMILLVGSLISIVYAILAARPRVNEKDFPDHGTINRKASVLFFGQYSSMTEEEFVDDMTEIMMDKNALYLNMIRDIYGIGRVLSRKFALLRTSYAVFMVGLVLGIAVFIGVYVWIVFGMGPIA